MTDAARDSGSPIVSALLRSLIAHPVVAIITLVVAYASTALLVAVGLGGTRAIVGFPLVVALGLCWMVSTQPEGDGASRRERMIANGLVALFMGGALFGVLSLVEVDRSAIFTTHSDVQVEVVDDSMAIEVQSTRELEEVPSFAIMALFAWLLSAGGQLICGVVQGARGFRLDRLEATRKAISGADACIACGSGDIERDGTHLVCQSCGYQARADVDSTPSRADLAALREPERRF